VTVAGAKDLSAALIASIFHTLDVNWAFWSTSRRSCQLFMAPRLVFLAVSARARWLDGALQLRRRKTVETML
jgi:hypothetical protein